MLKKGIFVSSKKSQFPSIFTFLATETNKKEKKTLNVGFLFETYFPPKSFLRFKWKSFAIICVHTHTHTHTHTYTRIHTPTYTPTST